MNHKTTAVRIIPVPGKKAGEKVEWGGLLGTAIVQDRSGPGTWVTPVSGHMGDIGG